MEAAPLGEKDADNYARRVNNVSRRDSVVPAYSGRTCTGACYLYMRNARHPITMKAVISAVQADAKTAGILGMLADRIVPRKFCLSQADLPRMIAGETVSIQQKFKAAPTFAWEKPGLLYGTVPHYQDKKGSLARRFVTFEFCPDESDRCFNGAQVTSHKLCACK